MNNIHIHFLFYFLTCYDTHENYTHTMEREREREREILHIELQNIYNHIYNKKMRKIYTGIFFFECPV